MARRNEKTRQKKNATFVSLKKTKVVSKTKVLKRKRQRIHISKFPNTVSLFAWRAIRKRRRTSRAAARRDSCSSEARSAKAAAGNDERAFVRVLSHIFMDTQLLIIAFLRIRTLDKLFEATIALVNFRICN